MNLQDFYTGRVVTATDMDTMYADMEDAEESLADTAGLSQGGASEAHKYGGILEGLVVTKSTSTKVSISAGAARDSSGRRITLPTSATVFLTNEGDTPEGDATDAVGDGAAVAIAASNEAWLSLWIVADTNLSDPQTDALGNPVYFRQTDSFHFHLELGTASTAPASNRVGLDADMVLLCDILLDANEQIRVISTLDAICGSSGELHEIAYGLDDAAGLHGRRSDWATVDEDGSGDLDTWKDAYDNTKRNNKAFINIRAGNARQVVREFAELFATPGSATKYGGSQLVGGKPTSGSSLSSTGGDSALDLSTGSVHDQLEELKDKVNTKLSRGTDTLTGSLTVSEDLTVGDQISADRIVLQPDASENGLLVKSSAGNAGVTVDDDGRMTSELGQSLKPLSTWAPSLAISPFDFYNRVGERRATWELFGGFSHPHHFEDDFNKYTTWAKGSPGEGWTEDASGSGTPGVQDAGGPGGRVQIDSGTTALDYCTLSGPRTFPIKSGYTGSPELTNKRLMFKIRYALPTGEPTTTREDQLGFYDSVNGNFIGFLSTNGGAWSIYVYDGSNQSTQTMGGSGPTSGTWQWLYLAIEGDDKVTGYVGGTTISLTISSGSAQALTGANWDNILMSPWFSVTTTTDAVRSGLVDYGYWADGALLVG